MDGLIAAEGAGVPYLRFAALADQPQFRHGVFTRRGGVSAPPYESLNVSLAVGDDRDHVLTNRARIACAVGAAGTDLRGSRQVHGADWRVVEGSAFEPAGEAMPADILLTAAPDVLLLMKFADCTPLVFWDPPRAWAAVAHAGWRGTALNVAATAVDALRQAAGSDPADLRVGIGPNIGPCCYEVGAEVLAAVVTTGVPEAAVVHPGRGERPHLDLAAANRWQLEAAGVPAGQIESAGRCTACEAAEFFSHRALGAPAGRFAVVVGVGA
jgi:hypothetical protein